MNHNLNDRRHPWSRLTAAARSMRSDSDAVAPFGFATRVAALAFAQESRVASLLDRFAIKAVGVAALLAIFSVALNYQAFSEAPIVAFGQSEEADVSSADDAVALVLGIAD